MFDCKKAFDKGICKAECCGPIPIKKELIKRFEHLAQRKVNELLYFSETEVLPVTEDLICVFLDEKLRCTIYDHRPSVCKKFGVTDEPRLQCPHMKQNGNFRSEAQKKRVYRQMKKFQNDELGKEKKIRYAFP